MFCPNCRKEVTGDGGFCPHCGSSLNEAANAETAAALPTTEETMAEVIGKNAAYYLPEFQRIDQGQSARFHVCAFFFGIGFLLYRRCGHLVRRFYLAPLLMAAVSVTIFLVGLSQFSILGMMVGGACLAGASLWMLISGIRCGKQFNRLYLQQCQTRLEGNQRNKYGTSLAAVFVYLLVVVGIVLAFPLTLHMAWSDVPTVEFHAEEEAVSSEASTEDPAEDTAVQGGSVWAVGQKTTAKETKKKEKSPAAPKPAFDVTPMIGTYVATFTDEYGDEWVLMLDIFKKGASALEITMGDSPTNIIEETISLPESNTFSFYAEPGGLVSMEFHPSNNSIHMKYAWLDLDAWFYLQSREEPEPPEVLTVEDFGWMEGRYCQAHLAFVELYFYFDGHIPTKNERGWSVNFSIFDTDAGYLVAEGTALYNGGIACPSFTGYDGNTGTEYNFEFNGYNFVVTSNDGAFCGNEFFSNDP